MVWIKQNKDGSTTRRNDCPIGGERLSDRPLCSGSLYSCKICGLKPHPFDDGDVGAVKFMCGCGASGSWAATTDEAKAHWNKLAFCPNWNTENDKVSLG